MEGGSTQENSIGQHEALSHCHPALTLSLLAFYLKDHHGVDISPVHNIPPPTIMTNLDAMLGFLIEVGLCLAYHRRENLERAGQTFRDVEALQKEIEALEHARAGGYQCYEAEYTNTGQERCK